LRSEETKDKAGARRCLIRGIGEILRAIQKNSFLITKPEVDRIQRDYKALNNNSESFRGVQPITMEVKHMVPVDEGSEVPNIRQNYNVTDKADGLRILAFCDPQGELFLLDQTMNIYKTGLINKACPDCLLDGEWVTRSIEGRVISHILLFDIYYLEKVNVSGLPFYVPDSKESRYAKLQEWITAWDGDSDGGKKRTVRGMTPATEFHVFVKQFEFANPANPNTIFAACAAVLAKEHIYHTDGLILTPNTLGLPQKSSDTFWEQFKWKPAEANSIDFLVKFEKKPGTSRDLVEFGSKSDSDSTISYKTLRLFVASTKDPVYDDPRATILKEAPLPLSGPRRQKQNAGRRETRQYQPSYFIPLDYPDVTANTCHLPVHIVPGTDKEYVETADTKEPIMENMIVEMRYDLTQPPGWRWTPMRIRHDKTERFAKAERMAKGGQYVKGSLSRTLNSELNATSVWNSIHNPITLTMITTGAEEPTKAELDLVFSKKRYYNREATEKELAVVQGLRNFHNHWIKELLLYKPTIGSGGKTVLDLACGPGGDLAMWSKNKVSFVLGVDVDENNIYNNESSIYRRYMNQMIDRGGRDKMPPMVFVQANSTLPLSKGEGASNEDGKNILRALFARESPDAPVPPLIQNKLTGRLRDGADVAVCMFALHYFLSNMESFNGFLKNLEDCVKVGGYFIGCCTDGKKAFELLKDVEEGDAVEGSEGETLIWSIKKGYEMEELRPDETSVGLPIDVRFISIGAEHTEYLVNFDYLTKRLDEIGFALLTDRELAGLPGGLKHSTNLFENSYKMVPDGQNKFPMKEAVREFSFLSRWFIFKRRGAGLTEPILTGPALAKKESEEDEESEEEEKENKVIVLATSATAPPAGTPVSTLPLPDAVFEPSQIFQFGPEVGPKDPLGVGDLRSPKILAPYWPFPIADEEDGTEYPSLEHYWEAMKLKYGANKPSLAITLLSTKGTIHQASLEEMTRQRITPNPSSNEKKATLSRLLLAELVSIKEHMSPDRLQKEAGKAVIDPGLWNRVKDYHYRRGLELRLKKDEMFKKIVEKARAEKKYLLYYRTAKIGDPTGELSGIWRTKDGRIEGENRIGRLLMEVAKFKF